MMTLNEYLKKCEELGYPPMLPSYFDDIVDRVYYKPTVIAKLTKVSAETARRWFRTHKLVTESTLQTYKVSGKRLKEFLFTLPRTYNECVERFPEIFESSNKQA